MTTLPVSEDRVAKEDLLVSHPWIKPFLGQVAEEGMEPEVVGGVANLSSSKSVHLKMRNAKQYTMLWPSK